MLLFRKSILIIFTFPGTDLLKKNISTYNNIVINKTLIIDRLKERLE